MKKKDTSPSFRSVRFLKLQPSCKNILHKFPEPLWSRYVGVPPLYKNLTGVYILRVPSANFGIPLKV